MLNNTAEPASDMRLEIRKATPEEVDRVAGLYEKINDYLDSHINYPGWNKEIYPIREDAKKGILENTLFVAIQGKQMAGTMILNHQHAPAYSQVDWQILLDPDRVLLLHTLAVHPDFLHRGLGRRLVQFAIEYAAQEGMQALRLDVSRNNSPAARLYESMGFRHMGTVSFGYGETLDPFRLYQLLLP